MRYKIDNSDKIFIAGSFGMVGSAIKRKLLNYKLREKKDSLKILTPTKNELNLLNSNSVKNFFVQEKPTLVILAAAKVGGIYANSQYPADFLIENLKIQTNVIESAWSNNVKKFLFLGSSCIYPKHANQPIREESLLKNELESTNEPYAIAKIAGLKLCESLRTQYNFDAISLMPTNLYGPNDNYHHLNSHVVAALIRKFIIAKKHNLSSVTCWGSGSVFREFMHVDDLADAVIFCIENWNPSDKKAPKDSFGKNLNHLNVGTGKDIKIRKLANIIADIIKYDGEILWDTSKPDGTPKKQLDVTRINNLGWHAKIDLETGLSDTIKNLNYSQFTN